MRLRLFVPIRSVGSSKWAIFTGFGFTSSASIEANILLHTNLLDLWKKRFFFAIEFIQVGSHEKFYESLKKYLREIKG